MAHGFYRKNSTFYRRTSRDCRAHPERGDDRQRPVLALGDIMRHGRALALLHCFRLHDDRKALKLVCQRGPAT